MGSIAGGNTTLRSSRIGCQNEQQLTKRWSLWPSLFASFCTGQKEVVGRARKPAFYEADSPRTAVIGGEVRKEEDLSTTLKMTGVEVERVQRCCRRSLHCGRDDSGRRWRGVDAQEYPGA